MIVPKSLRTETLSNVHEGHRGIATCKSRARDVLFWPNVNFQIEGMVSNCSVCNEHQKVNKNDFYSLITSE